MTMTRDSSPFKRSVVLRRSEYALLVKIMNQVYIDPFHPPRQAQRLRHLDLIKYRYAIGEYRVTPRGQDLLAGRIEMRIKDDPLKWRVNDG